MLSPVSTSSPAANWPEQGQWTLADWERLPADGYRYEVLDGYLFMSPPPSIEHQRSSGNLFALMWAYAHKFRLGEVMCAPVGVKLPGQAVPVQPDIVFVRAERLDILGKAYVEGAPDLIVEILSPSNWWVDRHEKFAAYQTAGVREYWLADYRARTIEVFVWDDGEYVLTGRFGAGATVTAQALPGFAVAVDDIFTS